MNYEFDFTYGGKYSELCDLTEKERKAVIQLAKDCAAHYVDRAAGLVEADLELISPEAEAAFSSRDLKEGVDYEIGVFRQPILDLKKELQ